MIDEKIIPFLESLIVDIKNKKLSEDQLKKISELYLNFKFQETNQYSDNDILKFTALGWYIYSNQNK